MDSTLLNVQPQVEALRRKLLDLSLRNRMLNYRPSKRLGITVLGEDSIEIHRLLVESGRKLTFTGKPDPPKNPTSTADVPLSGYDDPVSQQQFRRDAEDELNAYLEAPYATVNRSDTKLNTEEPESVLQAKLRTIQREAVIAGEELGIDTLFLTLGTLEWREPGAERSCKAPLLFVPVLLERAANGGLRLVHAGGDVGDNLPLRAKLLEFGVSLPVYDDETGVALYFDSITATIRNRADWALHADDIALGFFNYEKYAMYVDLGGESWPADRKPWQHPDIVAMLGAGYGGNESPIADDTFLDPFRPVAEAREIYDADSSQTIALLRAGEGLSLVVEGPPGTGKSQTITNIIAEAVAQGKKVLFVSAKRAALDVVKRRLEEAGLGAVCLDLHDKLTNRREFYQELKRTAELSLSVRNEEARVARLTELRDRLNAHDQSVNDPLDGYDCTPFQAMARLAALPRETPEDREGRIEFARLKHWPENEFRTRISLVEAIQARLSGLDSTPREHAFWGVRITHLDPGIRLDLDQDLAAACKAWDQALSALATAFAAFGVSFPATFGEARKLRACLDFATSAPAMDGLSLDLAGWRQQEAEFRTLVACVRRRGEIRSRRGNQVTPEAWGRDWSKTLAILERRAEEWHRWIHPDFHSARGQVRGVSTPAAPTSAPEQRDLLRDLQQVFEDEAVINAASNSAAAMFGVAWRGTESDPEHLEELLNWSLVLGDRVESGDIPSAMVAYFTAMAAGAVVEPLLPSREPRLTVQVDASEAAFAAAMEAEQAVNVALQSPPLTDADSPTAVASLTRRRRDDLSKLPAYLQYATVRRQAEEQGLTPVLEIADGWGLARERLSAAFQRSYYEGLLREAIRMRPPLREFDREAHEAAVREFGSLDDFKLAYNRAQVRLSHHRRLPSFTAAAGNLLLLRQQCELQRRQKPIRWIMGRAGEAIQHVKPVFMMSPLSAAIHLPAECPPFDLVIFDEASQVRPEDALCAIARANQTLVVGDTRQMPPTSFFDRVVDDEELDDEALDDAAQLGAEARKLESILAMMSAVTVSRARRPDLRWHYRSLHPALIQPSNELFYGNRLVVFPSPEAGSGRGAGVAFHHLPETEYEGGDRRRINRKEAEAVIEAVSRHVNETPELSLMVAAMNKPQADLIYEMLQVRERQDPQPFAAFRNRHPHEPLDVKNLENVQGDERDVVFISITYGRDKAGVIRQNFGPILRDGGERRLNVLITRARRRCDVFSNLTADDLRVDPSRPGLVALQRYLRFAQAGVLQIPRPTGEAPDSPFEEEVIAGLSAFGYEVDTQVGSEGYRLDLAVRDPDAPGRYLLGVECDGATYHSARSARDRDKLRQRVLEARGWRLHRIWSCDWWQDPQREIERLRAAVEAARSTREADVPSPPPSPVEEVEITESKSDLEAPAPLPYMESPAYDGDGSLPSLKLYAYSVVRVEGPILDEALIQRLRVALGFGRAGANIRASMEGLLATLEREGLLTHDEDTWQFPGAPVVVRDWSVRSAAERKVENVPGIELAEAITQVVSRSYGISIEDAARGALSLLGFKRATEKAVDRATKVIERLIASGRLATREGLLHQRP